MTRRPRRNHTPAFKSKVALEAIKGGSIYYKPRIGCRPQIDAPDRHLFLSGRGRFRKNRH